MATLTVTATPLACYSSRVVGMTVVALDIYHVLHGLGATPHEINVTLRSASLTSPVALILASYDATMAYFNGSGEDTNPGQADVFLRRVHALIL